MPIAAPSNAVDWDNVIEEIEALGRGEWRGVESQLAHALAHILKAVSDPRALSVRAPVDLGEVAVRVLLTATVAALVVPLVVRAERAVVRRRFG